MNARAFVVVCLFMPGVANAGNVTFVEWDADPHDTLVGPLRASFALHARAASRWLVDGTWEAPVTPRAIHLFAEQYMDATFASLHYTFVRNGQEQTRIYHAMSGDDAPWSVKGMTPLLDYRLYVRPRRGEIWARRVDGETTSIESSPLVDDMPLDIYTASAEYKAMRSVERDIEAKLVEPQGQAVFFISRPSCKVCESAIHYFARRYASDTRVHRIADAGSPLSERFIRDRRAFLSTVWASLPAASGKANFACPAAIPPAAPFLETKR
ncbi:hypothetical protein L2Y96_02460 [Luteibacter aegosomaticola]|uniref:hypothetical protein n=1 Tax=Luteibacter aegosomaticola TaxID=2911538 RepID=UPI001FFAEEC6|nr:hypothetical protein [Luteibacter aegosomaticola]UPG90655.1 hypothetical protein L2Y96_02460 [Luteibacter aegosomaticola]